MEAKDKAKDKTEEIKLDENRYSRTIFTYGIETMKKLLAMKVLIVGMRGLGVETAKNIISTSDKRGEKDL